MVAARAYADAMVMNLKQSVNSVKLLRLIISLGAQSVVAPVMVAASLKMSLISASLGANYAMTLFKQKPIAFRPLKIPFKELR